MKCNRIGHGVCLAGAPDDTWIEGFVYCDHAIEHEHGPACNSICKLNPDATCTGDKPVQMLIRKKKVINIEKPVTSLLNL